jgi:methylisocitrate lyase
MKLTPGEKFRGSLRVEVPLQIVGTVNAYCALLAQAAGYRAIYLSGAGVANASWGMPDLGMTSLADVAEDVRRIVSATELPLLVDADTGWGYALSISRTVKTLISAGAAGMHIEDQEAAKRCGHRPNKSLVPAEEMVDRIRAAVDSRTDHSFVIMARTDAVASEGIDAAIERCQKYIRAGADMIFAEAIRSGEQYNQFTEHLAVPVLANMTEFGTTPLMTVDELRKLGIAMVLYPLSAFRAMNASAENIYQEIRKRGTQANLVDRMQTRERLYEVLDYYKYEQQMDAIITRGRIE